MSSPKLVYQALQTFDRPVTRLELERATGLNKDGVHAGLRRLMDLGLLITELHGKHAALHELDRTKPVMDMDSRKFKTNARQLKKATVVTRKKKAKVVIWQMPPFLLGECWKGKKT